MIRPRRIQVVEGESFDLDQRYRVGLYHTLRRLHLEMGLRLFPLAEHRNGFKIWNIIGTIDIGGVVIDVVPKTRPGAGWISSVLSLLLSHDRISITGELSVGLSQQIITLGEALAAIYARRLLTAIRHDGPIALIRRQHVVEPVLRGKIIVSQLLHHWFSKPGYIPQDTNSLTVDNYYSRALSFVAFCLANQIENERIRASLFEAVALLTAGDSRPQIAPPGIETRALPQQFAAYQPAWSIVVSVLARRSLFGPSGEQIGMSLAVEPWPLLERLLERALIASCREALRRGRILNVPLKGSRLLLSPFAGPAGRSHKLIPDGILAEGGSIIATFEAKYRQYGASEGPLREEVYQAIASARATSAPLAVLVYPGRHDAAVWEVVASGQSPRYLATIGLDLFSYHQQQDVELGIRLYELFAPIMWNIAPREGEAAR